MKKIKGPATPQKGAVTVLVALLLPVLLGVGALAVDLAYLHVVRNELQNDADAAALAGARKLYTQGASALNWTGAATTASNAISLNHAAGHALTQGQVTTGYWDTTQSAKGLQDQSMTPGPSDAPAVQVTLGKTDTQNQGPVQTFLASIWGVYAKPVRVTAVAGVHSPTSAALTFPVAIAQCMYQTYWDLNTQPPAPKVDPKTQKPFVFEIANEKSSDPCAKGQWTALNFEGNGASLIADIIEHKPSLFDPPPPMLSVGDTLTLESGSKTSLYKTVDECIGARIAPCDLVVLPIVDQVVPGSSATIRGFACMKLLEAEGGSKKYIKVQMSNECPSLPSGGIGPNYGVISPPSLYK
ncbi:TadG family pilus assembly protein [Limnohabitans sp.]|uniref:TadG family pilus assembly protein n=1 Tax=Limnohabitans sp. TaxID=1907725 RepID=UPI0039BCDE80|nr:pilus assembly protein TadG-related protein [Comamonadaceae bacterium]